MCLEIRALQFELLMLGESTAVFRKVEECGEIRVPCSYLFPNLPAFTELIVSARFLSDPALKRLGRLRDAEITVEAVSRTIFDTSPRAIRKLMGLGPLLANSATEILSNPTYCSQNAKRKGTNLIIKFSGRIDLDSVIKIRGNSRIEGNI